MTTGRPVAESSTGRDTRELVGAVALSLIQPAVQPSALLGLFLQGLEERQIGNFRPFRSLWPLNR